MKTSNQQTHIYIKTCDINHI